MKTALITGATEGIGYEFTKLFAHNGINLVLVARNENRLNEIKAELSDGKIDIRCYAKDLSILDNTKYIYNDLKERRIAIDYLLNNAGFGINDDFIKIDWENEHKMLNLNMISLAYFTKVFAKDMVLRKYGRILNLGSTGSFQPGPFMASYCATKAFVLSLSEAVNCELKGTNVSVTALCPGVTDTKFHSVAQTGNTILSKFLPHAQPKDVAKYGFKLMMDSKSLGIHGFTNKLIVFSSRFSSRNLLTTFTAKMLRRK